MATPGRRRTVFSVTERATAESLPIEKMVDTLCSVEDMIGNVNDVMVQIHEDIEKLVETAQSGTEKSNEALEESSWMRLHFKESVEAVKELTEELRRQRGVSDDQ